MKVPSPNDDLGAEGRTEIVDRLLVTGIAMEDEGVAVVVSGAVTYTVTVSVGNVVFSLLPQPATNASDAPIIPIVIFCTGKYIRFLMVGDARIRVRFRPPWYPVPAADRDLCRRTNRRRRRNANTTISTNSHSIRAVFSSVGALDPDFGDDTPKGGVRWTSPRFVPSKVR